MEISKNKKILIIIGVIIIIIAIILILLCLPKATNEVAKKETVKHEVVDKLYQELEKEDDTKEYISKLYGYSYDDKGNLIMQVKEGYIENNKVYDLEGQELGDYQAEEINNILEKGTLKTYNYTKKNNDYIKGWLKFILLMFKKKPVIFPALTYY